MNTPDPMLAIIEDHPLPWHVVEGWDIRDKNDGIVIWDATTESRNSAFEGLLNFIVSTVNEKYGAKEPKTTGCYIGARVSQGEGSRTNWGTIIEIPHPCDERFADKVRVEWDQDSSATWEPRDDIQYESPYRVVSGATDREEE